MRGTLRLVETSTCKSADLERALGERGQALRSRRLLARVQRRPFRWLVGASGATRGSRLANTQRGGRAATAAVLNADPLVVLGAHIEALVTADSATLRAMWGAVARFSATHGTDTFADTHAQLRRVHTQIRGFADLMPADERRALLTAIAGDPLYEPVFQRVVRELSYERRNVAAAATWQLRDLAISKDAYRELSGVCALTPCAFEDLWPLVSALR